MARAVLLDCDPGHDDAVAMLLAYGSPQVDLVAVTTVAGNQILEKVTRNALSVAAVLGMTAVPVAAGCSRPLVQEPQVAASIHGDSGLEGPRLREPTVELDPRHAVDLLVDTVMSAAPREVTLVPTGPLTNVALAVRKEPRIVERVREVVLMGGACRGGNRSPVAEFNVHSDPEAAAVVFGEPWAVTMVGLDLTSQALATPEVLERVREVATTPARFVVELLESYAARCREHEGFDHPPVHDPCAVAYVADPDVMTVRRAPVDVELTGTITRGMTVVDFRAPAPPGCRTQVAVRLDRTRFWGLVIDALHRIGEVAS